MEDGLHIPQMNPAGLRCMFSRFFQKNPGNGRFQQMVVLLLNGAGMAKNCSTSPPTTRSCVLKSKPVPHLKRLRQHHYSRFTHTQLLGSDSEMGPTRSSRPVMENSWYMLPP